MPLRKRVRFAEGTNFEMKPPPEWKKARLDDVNHGDDNANFDDEDDNHMGATEVEDVSMPDEAPPIVSNGDEDEYETEDEDYNYDGPTAEDVQRVMAEEAQAEICNYPPCLAHAHSPPPAEEEPRNAFFLSDPQPAAMSGGFGGDVLWSIEEEENKRLWREPSPPPPPPPPPPQKWLPREVHDLTPHNNPLPPASSLTGTHARGSSLQRHAKKEHKHSKHRVDRGSAGVRKAQSSHRQRSNLTTAQQARHGSAGSAAKNSGSAPPAAQKLSKEQLRRNQFLDWYMNHATQEEKEKRREMLRHNRTCFTDEHIESAPTTRPKRDTAHGNSRASNASSGALKRSHKALPRKKSANYNRQAQSGGNTTPDTIPSVQKPCASLLTDIQQQANVNTEKAVRATSGTASQSTKLKALKVCLLAAAGHLKLAAEVTANATSSDHATCLASLQSAFHAVEGAAQAVQAPLQDSFLQQAYSLIIDKLRSACQLRLRLAERKLVRSTEQEPSAEQEQEWKQRGACAASLLTEGSSSSRRGALHRAACDSSLGTLDEKQRIRKLILDLRPDFSDTKNCM
ncbi:hypothetical protein ABBQ38_010393 [Trebouxia sp. C0009 RCD-2024]